MKPRRPEMLSSNIDGVPQWVSRGASSGDMFSADKNKHRADHRDEAGFLRLPPIARNPTRAVHDYLQTHKVKADKAKLNRKMKGIVEAMPLEEASLLPLVGGNRHDPALEGYSAAANEAARRHQAQRYKAQQERERKARLPRTFSNKNVWRETNEGTRTRVELTARNLHKAQFVEKERKQQQQQQHTPQSHHLHHKGEIDVQGNNADVSLSPYSKHLRAAPMVSFVPADSSPVFVIDGEEREQQEEEQRRIAAAAASSDEKDASLTSLPDMMHSPDSGSLQHEGSSPGQLQLQLQPTSSGDKSPPHQVGMGAGIKLHDSPFGEPVDGNYEDDDDDDDRPHVSELTRTYLRMLEKNEGFERRNIDRSFGEQLQSLAPHRDRLISAVKAVMRERRGIELEEEKARATTVAPEFERETEELFRVMRHDRGYALFHEQQRPACPVLRADKGQRNGGKINIDMHHSTTYVVEWRHRNTHPALELIATLLDGDSKVIATASKNNTVRSREGITCVRPFSTASPSLVRLGPVTHRSCLQVSLVTLPPQTRSILFSVVMPWQTLHQRDNFLIAQASSSKSGSSSSSKSKQNGADDDDQNKYQQQQKKFKTPGGATITAAALERTAMDDPRGSNTQHMLSMSDAQQTALFQGFESIGAGWLTVFDALPLVQTVGAHLAPHEVPVLEEVTTVELSPSSPALKHCVAVTLGGFHLDHRSRTPAIFQAMDKRYVGGKKVVENMSHFAAKCNDAGKSSFSFESAVECLVEEMQCARAALLLPLMALYEAFDRQKVAIEERKGDPRRLLAVDESAAVAAVVVPSSGSVGSASPDDYRRKSLAPAPGPADWRSRPQTPTVGFARSTPTPPPVLFEPREVECMGREELYEEFQRGAMEIAHKIMNDALTKTASSIL